MASPPQTSPPAAPARPWYRNQAGRVVRRHAHHAPPRIIASQYQPGQQVTPTPAEILQVQQAWAAATARSAKPEFGNDRALLVDSGATPEPELFPLRATVDRLLAGWLAAHPRDRYELLVAHSHSHSDHVAGDGQFADRPDTTVVGADQPAVTGFLGLRAWPDGIAQVDLGDRVMDVIPSPGHDDPAVTWYDRSSGLLLTGDTLYPGRLYVFDWTAFTATVDRLLAFTQDHPVGHLLGAHIEMTRSPGVDYVIRTTYQPEEPPLELRVADLRALRRAIEEVGDTPGVHPYERFVLYHGVPDRHFG